MSSNKLPKGFSFQINGGVHYAGFYVRFTAMSWRLCLGWVAITLMFYDFEPALVAVMKRMKNDAQ